MFREKKRDRVILSASMALSFARNDEGCIQIRLRLLHACPRDRNEGSVKAETRINRGETANNRTPLFRWPGFFSPRADKRRAGATMMIGLKGTPERGEKI